MYTAEHLDLVTNVSDQFTSPLTRLSGLLETVGQQADALDPIRIRVEVHDRELRQLQRRVATASASNFQMRGGPFSGVSGGTDVAEEPSHVPDEITDPLQNIRRNTDALDDSPLSGNVGRGGSALATGAIVSQLASLNSNIQGGGDDDDNRPSVTPLTSEELFDRFGLPTSGALAGRRLRPEAMLSGESPFGVPPDALEELIFPEAFSSALDTRGLANELTDELIDDIANNVTRDDDGNIVDFDVGRQRLLGQLSRMAPDELVDAFGVDELDGVYDRLTRNVSESSLQFHTLKEAVIQSRVGMTQFYDILAGVLPLLLVAVGALPAAISGIVALGGAALGAAAALAGIAGLGLVGAAQARAGGGMPTAEDFQDVFDGLGEAALESFRPLTRRLAPLFDDGIEGVEGFLDELAQASMVLLQLRNDARAFGQFAGEYIAGATEELLQFADAARPVFSMAAGGLDSLNITRGLAGVLAETLPSLHALVRLLGGAVPSVISASVGFLETLVSILQTLRVAFMTVIVPIDFVTGSLIDAETMFGRTAATGLALISVLLLAANVSSLLSGRTLQLATSILASKLAYAGTTQAIRSYIASLVSATVASKVAALATTLLAKAIAGLLALTGVGLLLVGLSAGVSILSDRFLNLSGNIDEATSSLREFQRQRSSMGSRGGAPIGDLDRAVYVEVNDSTQYNVEGDMDEATQQQASFDSTSVNPTAY